VNDGVDSLDGDRINRALRGAMIGREIFVLRETTSTNDAITRLGNDATEGVVIFAETQTAGRGQRGNRWESQQEKGLWFSTLLQPDISIAESASLTTWAAQAIAGTLWEEYRVAALVRLPNDVYVKDKKIAGVLVEMRARPASTHAAVLGIGVNVNHAEDDFSNDLRARATSLRLELSRMIDRNDVAIALLNRLDATYAFRKSPPLS